MHRRVNLVFFAFVIAAMALLVGCSSNAVSTEDPIEQPPSEQPSEDTGSGDGSSADEPAGDADAPSWTGIELTDVETGETFTIGELSGTPVYVQAFAVW